MYRKSFPRDLHVIHTKVFRENPPPKKIPVAPTSSALKPELIEKQKKHPNEMAVENPPSKRFKFQKG